MTAVKIVEVKTAQTGQNPHGVESKSLYNSEHATVTHLTLKPESSSIGT